MTSNSATAERVAITADLPFPEFAPRFSSPVIKAGDWIFCSGTMATDFTEPIAEDGQTDPRALYRPDAHDYDRLAVQSHATLRRLEAMFAAAGGDLRTDTTRIEQFFRSPHPTQEDFDTTRDTWARGISITAYLDVRNEYIDEARPPSVGFAVTDLPIPGADLQVDLIGKVGVEKERFETPKGMPSPLAGYSPAIRFGDWVGLAGEVPTDWAGDWMSEKHMGRTGSTDPATRPNEYLWYGNPMELQVELVIDKQEKIAEAAGAPAANLVNATTYIGHPADFSALDKVWRRRFPDKNVARTVVPYAGLGGKGWRFETTWDLLVADSSVERRVIETSDAPEPFGWEPQAVKAGDLVFLSTQRAIDSRGILTPTASAPAGFERYVDDGRRQMDEILGNIAKIVGAAGTSLQNVCRIKVFMDDWSVMPGACQAIAEAFPNDPPAVSLHRVNGAPMLAPGVHIAADVIAYAP